MFPKLVLKLASILWFPSSCHSISTSLLLQHLLAALCHFTLNSPAVPPRLKWAFLILALWLPGWADLYQGPWHGPETSHLLRDSSCHPWLHLGSAHSHSFKFMRESQNAQCTVSVFETELKSKGFCISIVHIWDCGDLILMITTFCSFIHRLQRPTPQLGFWLNIYAE